MTDTDSTSAAQGPSTVPIELAPSFHGLTESVGEIKTMLAVQNSEAKSDRQRLAKVYEALVEGIDGRPSGLTRLLQLEDRVAALEAGSAARKAGLWELAKELAKLAGAAAIGAVTGRWIGH